MHGFITKNAMKNNALRRVVELIFCQAVAEEMVNVYAKRNVYASRRDSLGEEENPEDRNVETQCLTTTKCVPTSLDVITAKLVRK